jgi:DNA-damage-inducible protein D
MTDNPSFPSVPASKFEDIKRIDENGIEYWEARELMSVLGYTRWENFEEVVKKAQIASINSGQDVDNHFRKSTKIITVGYNTAREFRDWKLDRYACYLIAQNGDSKKAEIALAQTYFAIQSRKQEVYEILKEEEKRLYIRDEVSKHNKQLFATAKSSGVSNFGYFNDAGYKGLYGKSLVDVEKKKGIKKGELLDKAGATELAANLFRITQTDEKLKKDKTRNQYQAANTHFMVGGKVRQTIKEIGGVLPEDMPAEKQHIAEVKRKLKKIGQEENTPRLASPKK